jgi:hypothetical protein
MARMPHVLVVGGRDRSDCGAAVPAPGPARPTVRGAMLSNRGPGASTPPVSFSVSTWRASGRGATPFACVLHLSDTISSLECSDGSRSRRSTDSPLCSATGARPMPLYQVTAPNPSDHTCTPLASEAAKCEACWPIARSVWLVFTHETPDQLRDRLSGAAPGVRLTICAVPLASADPTSRRSG